MPEAVVFAPCEPVLPGDADVRLVLLDGRPGEQPAELLLPAWSSLGRLVAACGPQQPWVSIPLRSVDEVRALAGAVAVLLDAAPAATAVPAATAAPSPA